MKRRFTILTAALALLAILAIPMGMKGQAPVGTTLWGETWTGGDANETPSAYGFEGTTVYGGATLTYAQSSTNTKLYEEALAGGESPELLLSKSNQTWTISNIPTGQATGMALTFKSNKTTFDVTSTTTGITISGSQKSWTIASTSSVTTFNLTIKNTGSSNARIDDIVLNVTTAGGDTPQPTTYTVTYDANGGSGTMTDSNSPYTAGATVTVLGNEFTRTDYEFDHWNTAADDSGTSYDEDDTFTINANTTLYAQWTENTTPTPSGITATLNIQTYAEANSWINSTQYTTATVAPVTFTANGSGNTGKYYTNGQDWRFYQNESASITISVAEGYTLVSVTPTYSVSNGGVLKNGNATIASGTTVSVSGTSVTFTVGNSGSAANGQVRFTNIDVVYVSDGGTQTTSDLTITNTSTDLSFDLYNNSDAQVITYTTSSTGAITITPAESNYFTYVHDAQNKTITVTPTTVTPSAQTVTISQEADDDYYAGTATFTVSITDSTPLNNIAALTAQTVASTYNVALTDAVVTYVYGNYAYIQDASGAVVYYKNGHGLTAGDVLNGAATVAYQLRNGNPQITNLTGVTPVSGTAPNPTEVAASEWNYTFSNVLSQYFKVTGATLTQSNNKYYVSLGGEDIQLYKVGESISGIDLSKTYSITGFPTMYNATKELQIFADPEAEASAEPSITFNPNVFDFDAEQHVLQIPFTYENIKVTNYQSFTTHFYNAEGEEIQLVQGEAWCYCSVTKILEGEGYQLTGVVTANEGEARSAYMKVSALDADDNTVYSNLVTVNQAEYVEPTTYTLASSIVSGKTYIISNGTDRAMGAQSGNVRSAATVSIEDNVATVTNSDVYEFVITGSAEDGYTIYDVKDQGYLYASSSSSNNIGTRAENSDDNSMWTIDFDESAVTISAKGDHTRNHIRYNYNNGNDRFSCYAENSSLQDPLYLYVKDETPASYTLNITGYQNDENPGGYYLIASPVTVDPSTVGMTTGEYDLYYFDQAQDDEWRNYKQNAFNLEPGKGYLYAHKTGGEFTLAGTPYDGDGTVTLHKTDDTQVDFQGWNLVGNPWGVKAYPDHAFYTMADGGAGIDVTPNVAGTEIAALTGIFVVAEDEGETMTFATENPNSKSANLALNITNSSKLVDRAIVRFGEGRQLPKFQLRDNSTKIYFEQSNKDYAIVNAEEIGEMPVSFKAENNGTYTFSVNTENVEMEYLHLIDNMTGADIDLIANPSYSFEAKVTDYASRFRLVFSANSSVNEQNANNFAFFNGNDWTINNEGEATLQVVDMTGRVLSTETVNGNATTKVNAATGVYMLRLINGNNIKTQKVVVK